MRPSVIRVKAQTLHAYFYFTALLLVLRALIHFLPEKQLETHWSRSDLRLLQEIVTKLFFLIDNTSTMIPAYIFSEESNWVQKIWNALQAILRMKGLLHCSAAGGINRSPTAHLKSQFISYTISPPTDIQISKLRVKMIIQMFKTFHAFASDQFRNIIQCYP